MTAYVGTSGWSYAPWKPAFYPPGSKAGDWLGWYAHRLNSVEVNNSFYRPPAEVMVARWAEAVPPSFRFAVKAWQGITHEKRLKNCADDVAGFYRGLAGFGDKLGVVLYQLPPSLAYDSALLHDFMTILPPGRAAMEFRHASWFRDETYQALAERNVAFCLAHLKTWTTPRVRTADFTYVRLHGTETAFTGGYMPDFLDGLSAWLDQGEAYVYFNNTKIGVVAPENAMRLVGMLQGL